MVKPKQVTNKKKPLGAWSVVVYLANILLSTWRETMCYVFALEHHFQKEVNVSRFTIQGKAQC
jgi:hypothetical protein